MEKENKKIENEKCNDSQCFIHGSLKTRGRIFKGYVTKKFPRRIVIEFEKIIYVRKYERYTRKKTKLHARIAPCMENDVNVGDYVMIQECRPLSKIIHFSFIKKIRAKNEKVKTEGDLK